MRAISAVLFVVTVQAQNRPGGYVHDTSGDTGEPYVHDPAWDLTPFQLYQLRQKGVSPQGLSQNSINSFGSIRPAAPSRPAYTQQQYQQSFQANNNQYQTSYQAAPTAAPAFQTAPQTADYIA